MTTDLALTIAALLLAAGLLAVRWLLQRGGKKL